MPFRLSMVAYHAKERMLSSLKIRSGFRIIDLALTYDCNLACQHCSAMVLKDRSRLALSLDNYKDIANQARALHLLSWNITGGEPLLVPWLEDLIPILEPRTHYISIQTNCMLLDTKKADTLARLGVNCITTSLDSVHPLEHDRFRGSDNSYKKVLEGARIARRAGMQVLIGGTVTHENIKSADLCTLIEKVNAAGAIFLFNLAVPCGNWLGNTRVVLTRTDRAYLEQLMCRYPKSTTDHEAGRNAIGCPAGMEKVYITAYGDVIPCPFIHISFGNVLKEPLYAIITRMRKVEQFKNYQNICVAAEDYDLHRQVFTKINSFKKPYPVSYLDIYGALDEQA